MRAYTGRGAKFPHILLDLGSGRRWMLSFML